MIAGKSLLDCELEYIPSPHLMQLYTGFFELKRQGVINLVIKYKANKGNVPIIAATINKKYKVIYDTLDGISWIVGDKAANLSYFQEHFDADFYFKRSYHPVLEQYKPKGCTVLPLGLNYNIQPYANMISFMPTVKDKIKYVMKSNKLLRSLFNKPFYYTHDFEHKPTKASLDKVLFITRLWNPTDAKTESARIQREQINEIRLKCIEACKKEFGQRFTGGISMDSYSAAKYQSYALPEGLTKKGSYLNAVKEHSVCIATTGLHDSIGWKLAEYVAASRAIITEPLFYEVPGDFKEDKNYLSFLTVDDLVHQASRLLGDKEKMINMMNANSDYYNRYVKPDNLILNTLLPIQRKVEKASEQLSIQHPKSFL
jgi:hypothetical protein